MTNSCGDNTYCQVLDTWPVNVNNIDQPDDVHIYPDPVNDHLYVKGAKTGSTIMIYDITGSSLISELIPDGEQIRINTANLLPGTYLLRVTNTNGARYQSRFVKQ